jgi:hypothetical protein
MEGGINEKLDKGFLATSRPKHFNTLIQTDTRPFFNFAVPGRVTVSCAETNPRSANRSLTRIFILDRIVLQHICGCNALPIPPS